MGRTAKQNDDKLKVALVGTFPPPRGGMSMLIDALSSRLTEKGAEVFKVDVKGRERKSVYRVGARDFTRMTGIMSKLIFNREKYDVINVHANSYMSYLSLTLPLIVLSKALKRPIVVMYHSGDAATFFSGHVLKTLPLFKKADKILVQSEFLKRFFDSLGVEAGIIPNFLYFELVPRKAQPFRILANRNLYPHYCMDVALRAFIEIADEFPQARLALAGSGTEAKRLRETAETAGLAERVEFLGSLDRPAMTEEYAKADVLINPSSVDNTPITLIEGLSFGLPIITTNVGGIPYMVEHEKTALMVPPKNSKAAADALRRLFTDSKLKKSLSANALKEAEKYTAERIVGQWIEVFNELKKKAG